MLHAHLELQRPGFRLEARLEAAPGVVTAVFGPSGAGKSTLLAAVAGLIRARGHCRLDGQSWQDDGTGVFLPPHRRRLGMVFQDARLFCHLTVARNLAFAARRRGTQGRIAEVVGLLGLQPLLDRRPPGLSGGERQRVALGRALLCDPALLLLDEPLSSLDVVRKAEILPFLERVAAAAEIPVLYVTHSVAELCRLADRVVTIRDGETSAAAPLAEALTRLEGNPLAGDDVCALLDCEVEQPSDEHGLASLAVAGQVLRIPAVDRPPGARLRVRVLARDVSLALEAPGFTSILNVLRGRIEGLRPDGPADALVSADIGGPRLLARISRLSVERLALVPGQGVFLQIKAIAPL